MYLKSRTHVSMLPGILYVVMYKTIHFVWLCKLVEKQEIICHNTDVATPRQARKGGVCLVEFISIFWNFCCG